MDGLILKSRGGKRSVLINIQQRVLKASESSLRERLRCRADACEGLMIFVDSLIQIQSDKRERKRLLGDIADPDQSKQVILGLTRRLLQFIHTAAGVAKAVIYLETSRPPRQNNYP